MNRFLLPAASLLLLAAAAPAGDDPYLWLEEVEGKRALTQVKEWNAATESLLTQDPKYDSYRQRALAILDDKEQIAAPDQIMGDRVANLWRDASNPRGLWRISSLAAYRAGKPQWRTVIDVDALGKAEGKSWVWHGADCLAPDYRRCLVSVSAGGTDADVVREFDLDTGRFVEGGFVLPEAKSNVAWVDPDTLLVGTDYGKGSLTTSGYGRILKLWKRGTPLASARTLFEGEVGDVATNPLAIQSSTGRWVFVDRGKTFWTNERHLLTPTGGLEPVPLPADAELEDVIGDQLIAKLQSPLGPFRSGTLVAYSLRDILARGHAEPTQVMAPTAKQAIEEVSASDNVLWVKALDDVSGKLFALTRRKNGTWASRSIALPANSTVHLQSVGGEPDLAFATVEGMLTPPALYAVRRGGKPSLVQRLPAKFDAATRTVEQRFATSKDGTKIPYFLVRSPHPCLWRLPRRPDPGLSDRPALPCRSARDVLDRGGQCLCPRQYSRRRRIWARMAQVGASREPAEELRRPPRRRRGSDPNRSDRQGQDRHFRPLQRRRSGRGGDEPAARSLFRGDQRLASARHEALFAFARGRLVDR